MNAQLSRLTLEHLVIKGQFELNDSVGHWFRENEFACGIEIVRLLKSVDR